MANMILHILTSAILFAEVGGQWTTDRVHTLEQSVRTVGEPKPAPNGSLPDLGPETNHLSLLTPYTEGTNLPFMLPKINKLKELLTHGHSGKENIVVSKLDKNIYKLDYDPAQFTELNNKSSRGLFQSIDDYLQRIQTILTLETNFKEQNIPSGNGRERVLLSTRHGKSFTSASAPLTVADLTEDKATADEGHVDIMAHSGLKTKRIFPFQVAVIVSKPRGPHRNSVIYLPLATDMTVLDAFVSATRAYMDQDTTGTENIPFNIVLDWNNKLQCYVTIEAVGVENRRRQAWYFTVRNYMHEIVYSDRCLPGDDVILRPRSSVQLTFEQKRRRSN